MLSAGSPVGVAGGVATETEDGVEGTGLLAETMRKVDRSFRARLVGGANDDLGYQYFVEKVCVCVCVCVCDVIPPLMAVDGFY